jgi:hypothetical protein
MNGQRQKKEDFIHERKNETGYIKEMRRKEKKRRDKSNIFILYDILILRSNFVAELVVVRMVAVEWMVLDV